MTDPTVQGLEYSQREVHGPTTDTATKMVDFCTEAIREKIFLCQDFTIPSTKQT